MPSARNGLEIRAELLRRGKTIADLAVLARVSRPLASRTVNGLENSRRVPRALVAIGVDKELPALPENLDRLQD